MGYFLRAQANFWGKIWFVFVSLRAHMRFDVEVLDFYNYILAVLGLATVLATFSKSWGILFPNLPVTLLPNLKVEWF